MHMHGESFTQRQIRLKREKGRRMANARWKADRERREALAAAEGRDPLRCPGGRIMRRIVVVVEEKEVFEVVIRAGDSGREINRKLRSAGLCLMRGAGGVHD
jgi:hypothetical protein